MSNDGDRDYRANWIIDDEFDDSPSEMMKITLISLEVICQRRMWRFLSYGTPRRFLWQKFNQINESARDDQAKMVIFLVVSGNVSGNLIARITSRQKVSRTKSSLRPSTGTLRRSWHASWWRR